MKQQKIVFFNDGHTYWYGDKKLKSVGRWLKSIFPEFEETYWLTHRTLKAMFGDEYVEHYRSFKKFTPPYKQLFGKFLRRASATEYAAQRQTIRWEWDRKRNESAFKGTNFHNKMEDEAYDRGWVINPWSQSKYDVASLRDKEYDNESTYMDLFDLPDGVHLELLVFDLDLGVAGQADEVFIETVGDTRYIDINDHKTNEKKPQKSAPTYCHPPFDGEYASTHFKYTMQINSYAYLLNQHGFEPRNLAYTHYKKYDKVNRTHVDVDLRLGDIHKIISI